MSEQIRSIEVVLTVDTNKRTRTFSIDADDLDDALRQFVEAISDVRWSL